MQGRGRATSRRVWPSLGQGAEQEAGKAQAGEGGEGVWRTMESLEADCERATWCPGGRGKWDVWADGGL